jgi:hypothetical protein
MSASDNDPELPKVTLPSNLPDILKRLDDTELETLLSEVTAEAVRRGLPLPKPVPLKAQKPQATLTKRVTSGEPVDLPAGKANLIRASHLAGMKPAAIARSFRLSQSVVKGVLNQSLTKSPKEPRS